MKKIILSVIGVVSIITSCSKEENIIDPKKPVSAYSSIMKPGTRVEKGKEYTVQLPYLDAHTDFMVFNVENELGKKMNDPKVDWKAINALYKPELNTAEKQYLIYILFAKKDILGLQNTNPTPEIENLIADYTKEMVNTKYIGYCLLYNALITLNKNPENKLLVKALAEQIAKYSEDEKFHSNFLGRPQGREQWLNRVKEDLSYLDKIKTEFTR